MTSRSAWQQPLPPRNETPQGAERNKSACSAFARPFLCECERETVIVFVVKYVVDTFLRSTHEGEDEDEDTDADEVMGNGVAGVRQVMGSQPVPYQRFAQQRRIFWFVFRHAVAMRSTCLVTDNESRRIVESWI